MKRFLVIFLTALTLLAGCGDQESPYDLTALNAKIDEANLVLEGVDDVADSASDVAHGRTWATKDDIDTFAAAILLAKATGGLATSQKAVDSATDTLDAKIFTFKKKIRTGTKTTGFTNDDLKKLTDEAEATQKAVKTSTDGTNVSKQEYWVTADKMTALNNAISTAKGTSGTIDSKYTALNTALNNLDKKPGTAASSRSITITGLSIITYPNGTEIAAGVLETNSIDLSTAPAIYGSGLVKNGQATIVFYSNNQTTLWTGDGSYYVGYMAKDDVYISKSKIAFSSAAPNPSAKSSDFSSYNPVYSYKVGDLASAMDFTIPASGTTLNNLCIRMTTQDYPTLIANNTLPGPFYKDSNCGPTQAFTGFETIYADTMIYCKYDLSHMLPGSAANQ